MNSPNPKHGITSPVTMRESTSESLELCIQMENYLKESDFFESEDAAQTRERVLGKLDFLVKRFVEKTASGSESRSFGGKIFTFGSYRLGVHDKGADIDALCVVPRHVSRKDFFTVFYEELMQDENTSELSKIEEAYVPLIKLKYHGIPIDLTFARLNIPVVKENISLLNDNILKSMDEKCIVSLNGSRVTDAMLHLVPSTEIFHSALRAIKFWAKRRHIYGNTYGYFGGVAYSICVARVCQMYPNMCAYDIVYKFFETYSSWKWPNPVQLTPIVDHNYNLKIWDPKVYPADKYHKMPVITPVYPSMCATHNVTQSIFNVVCTEFHRGYDIMKSGAQLTKLFEYSDYFRRYKIFVEVNIRSESPDMFKMWEGYIESKMRILSTKLENLENIVAAIPFPKAFRMANIGGAESACAADRDNSLRRDSTFNLEENESSCWFFIAIDVVMSKNMSRKVYVDAPIKDFLDFVNSWDLKTQEMRIDIKPKKKKDVQDFIRAFYKDK